MYDFMAALGLFVCYLAVIVTIMFGAPYFVLGARYFYHDIWRKR
jgi:hypothetical protein